MSIAARVTGACGPFRRGEAAPRKRFGGATSPSEPSPQGVSPCAFLYPPAAPRVRSVWISQAAPKNAVQVSTIAAPEATSA